MRFALTHEQRLCQSPVQQKFCSRVGIEWPAVQNHNRPAFRSVAYKKFLLSIGCLLHPATNVLFSPQPFTHKAIMNLHEIGARIYHIRVEVLHLSQREFARRLGISQGNLPSLEHGQSLPSCFFLWCLHATFRVNLHWLMTGQGEVLVHTEPSL